MDIRQLPDTIINQIAAGEVIERPANAIKELIENSIDAGASNIDIIFNHGGKSLIRVIDDGCGIKSDQLLLAISRHCTSKMQNRLDSIDTLGFRGEALPSIGSVSQLSIISRTADADSAYKVMVNGGKISEVTPTAGLIGTKVEVSNLFYTTPARLKFMKSDAAEANAILELVKRTAIAFPDITFSVGGLNKRTITFNAINFSDNPYLDRITQVLGSDFRSNSLEISAKLEDIYLSGFIGAPTFNKSNSLWQFVYVNGRPVKDKTILTAIRIGFMDSLASDRHGVAVLFLRVPPAQVDVNVHPTKNDVRFSDSNIIRSFIISTIRKTLATAPIKSASTNNFALSNSFKEPSKSFNYFDNSPNYQLARELNDNNFDTISKVETNTELALSLDDYQADTVIPSADTRANNYNWPKELEQYPMGAAKAQIHENYIISQTSQGIIIVDQHAAHERIVYEKLKNALYSKPLEEQMLLLPEVINLGISQAELLLEYADELAKMGMTIELFGEDSIIVRSIPAILKKLDVRKLINDIVDDLCSKEISNKLERKIDYIAATIACHGSIRSGRILKPEEMNQLLRDIEKIPLAATCNHGRPTYIELQLNDIEKLFKRR